MNRSEALKGLDSSKISIRLEAARALETRARSRDRNILELRRRSEPVPWIRKSLTRTLAKISSTGVVDEQSSRTRITNTTSSSEQSEDIYAQAIHEVTDRFVHELRTPLGRARRFAEKEIPDFASSRTHEQLTRLQHFLTGLQELGAATETALMTEFDLTALVHEEVAAIPDVGTPLMIELRGPSNLPVVTDPALVRLAVSNGLKNAAEAVASSGTLAPIVMSWGQTDRECYVAILDRGPGVPEVTGALFEIGTSTKRGHIGLGLTIAQQASISLGGEIHLNNISDGTTRFEIRWPQAGESL